ncbi:MAG: carbohydrate kinase [Oscillospiraceae bacterium]|nr:carbohydrate kinase [Oscillospiraceae bacterium]
MKEHYLLIDLGTGSTRAALVSSDGSILSMRSFFNRYYRDEAYPDAQYFLPEEWERELMRCCREIHEEHPEIRVRFVSSAGARQSIVLLSRENHAFYGLPNIDNRGREFMNEIADPARIYERSGKWVTEDFCAAKLLGLRKQRPGLYDRIATVLSLSGWIAWLFTGKTVFEPSQACETQLYDLEKRSWSDSLCAAYCVNPVILPPLAMAGENIGEILPALKESLGMADDAGFIVGGADTQTALMQTGIEEGDIAVVSGTTSPVTALVDSKMHDPQQQIWVDANLGAKGYLIEMNPGVTGLNYQRIKDALCPDISYGDLEKAYARKTDFACTASFSSLLFYERRSLKNGGFFLASPFQDTVDRVDMLWAALADIACSIYEQLWRLRRLSGHSRNYILGCGGGFRSEALCQMLADLSCLELRLKPGYEQATLQGLTVICNEAAGIAEKTGTNNAVRCFIPQEGKLIHRYYPVWNSRRLYANSTVRNTK